MEIYKAIDLFAGAGGLSYGFLQTGRFRFVAAAEINENARNTYQRNIAGNDPNFVFIDNVVGYNFSALNTQLGGIDIVIGGPPCQGFSNANRQKNHLISMNNGLVKEYFRAIKEIHPRAFVMENVSMLRSETHRFYDSHKDNAEIEALIAQGYKIPKRKDALMIADRTFIGVDYTMIEQLEIGSISLPEELTQLLSVLNKNKNNPRRLPNYLIKHSTGIISGIDAYIASIDQPTFAQQAIINDLQNIKQAVTAKTITTCSNELDNIVHLQKALGTLLEIQQNQLIGKFRATDSGALFFDTTSYSVIDYINKYHLGLFLGGLLEKYKITISERRKFWDEIKTFATKEERKRDEGANAVTRSFYQQCYILSCQEKEVVEKLTWRQWQDILDRVGNREDERIFLWIKNVPGKIREDDWREFEKALHLYLKDKDTSVFETDELFSIYDSIMLMCKLWREKFKEFSANHPKSAKIKTKGTWAKKYYARCFQLKKERRTRIITAEICDIAFSSLMD